MLDNQTTWLILLGIIIPSFLGMFKIIYRYSGKKRRGGSTDEQLKFHAVHARMKSFKQYVQYHLETDCEARRELVKDFLYNTLSIYEKAFHDIAEKVDKNDYDKDELYYINNKMLLKSIEKRSSYFYDSSYTEEEKGALKALLSKYHKWNETNIEEVEDDIEKIVFSRFYNKQSVIQSIIFDKFIGEFARILTWFDEVVGEINGDLDGMKFKGKTFMPLH